MGGAVVRFLRALRIIPDRRFAGWEFADDFLNAPAREAALPKFAFEDRGRVLTERDIAAMTRSDERKVAEATRYRNLWDGFAPGFVIVEDESERGFHWADPDAG